MYCGRCGTPNESGDRFCSACGAALPGRPAPKAEKVSARERIGRLVGTSRRARLASAGTAVALAVAIVAFIVLKPAEDQIPRDAYTVAADRICLEAKAQIVAVEKQAIGGSTAKSASGFAQELVPVVSRWRSRFQQLSVPSDRREAAARLRSALLETELDIADLARAETGRNGAEIRAAAEEADKATSQVEGAVSSLGLDECASEAIGFSSSRDG